MVTLGNFFFSALFVGFLVTSGCAVKRIPTSQAGPRSQGRGEPYHRGEIIHVPSGKKISFDQLIHELGSKRLVFVGEVHDNPEHHLVQLQILQALSVEYGLDTAAMEFFQKDQQPALDAYISGTLREKEFLEEVRWGHTWGIDYYLYRPLLLFLKERKGRVLGINVPRRIVKKVARKGLRSLNPKERNCLAEHIDLTNEAHRAYVLQAYQAHVHTDLADFEYFYQAQCVWDDSMAANIAGFLTRSRSNLIVFTGNGHIAYKFGIPDRTVSRVSVNMVTVILLPEDETTDIKEGIADYVWITRKCSRFHSPES